MTVPSPAISRLAEIQDFMEYFYGFPVTAGQALIYSVTLVHRADPAEFPVVTIPTKQLKRAGAATTSLMVTVKAKRMMKELRAKHQINSASCIMGILVMTLASIRQAKAFRGKSQWQQ